MIQRDYKTTLERLCRDELALAGARMDEIEITTLVVADAVARSTSMSITDAIRQTRNSNPDYFRARQVRQ